MTTLTDTQLILLSTASRRYGGGLYPLSTSLTAPKHIVAKSITALMNAGLAEERETADPASVHRCESNQRYGVFITAAGLSGCCQSDANQSLHNAVRPLSCSASWQATATPSARRSDVP